jgi:FkbM family methyltransferase
MISEGEIYFFNQIKDDCKIVFDVGCKTDTPYLELAPKLEYHLFEPNPVSYSVMNNKLENSGLNVKLNNFGLGNETKTVIYYPDSESFFLRKVHFIGNPGLGIPLQIKSFKEYIEENKIDRIDFLKIDVEGGEPDILFPNSKWIEDHVKYLQFEYASTWYDNSYGYRFKDIYYLFKEEFNIYFLYNSAHPASLRFPGMMININSYIAGEVENYVNNQYGFEIAMVKK